MDRPNLFISHSTHRLKSTNRAVVVKERLKEKLKKEWTVFLDSDSITPGDKWRFEILEAIEQAQAAIILFNKKALESRWVTAEALIFCYRKSIDPDFQLIPVLMDGCQLIQTPFDQYEPFQLHAIQTAVDSGKGDAKRFADSIAARFDATKAATAELNTWIIELVKHLGLVSDDVLQRAAAQLAVEMPAIAKRLNRKALAQAMHQSKLERNIGAFEEFAVQLADPHPVKRLLTSLWVESKAAELMLYAIRNCGRKSLVVVNSDEASVTDQYRYRAQFEAGKPRYVNSFSVSAGGGDTDASRIHHIENSIRTNLFPQGVYPPDASLDAAVDAFLRGAKPKQIAICALPCQLAKPKVVQQIRTRFPQLVLLVEAGRTDSDLNRFASLDPIKLLPLLSEQKIKELKDREREINNILSFNK